MFAFFSRSQLNHLRYWQFLLLFYSYSAMWKDHLLHQCWGNTWQVSKSNPTLKFNQNYLQSTSNAPATKIYKINITRKVCIQITFVGINIYWCTKYICRTLCLNTPALWRTLQCCEFDPDFAWRENNSEFSSETFSLFVENKNCLRHVDWTAPTCALRGWVVHPLG